MSAKNCPYSGKGTSTEFISGKPDLSTSNDEKLISVNPTDEKDEYGNTKLFDDKPFGTGVFIPGYGHPCSSNSPSNKTN